MLAFPPHPPPPVQHKVKGCPAVLAVHRVLWWRRGGQCKAVAVSHKGGHQAEQRSARDDEVDDQGEGGAALTVWIGGRWGDKVTTGGKGTLSTFKAWKGGKPRELVVREQWPRRL